MQVTFQFQKGIVEEEYDGKAMKFEFVYHSPMEWLMGIVTDPTLAHFIAWHPYKKFLHTDRKETPMYDELCTGEHWWNIQVCFDQLYFIFGSYCFTVKTTQLSQMVATLFLATPYLD